MLVDPALMKAKPEIYWNMLQTAEQVARRYGIGRDAMDEYGAASQQKACAAQAAGKFNDEIAPITVTAGVVDKVMGLRTKKVTVSDGRRHPPRHHQGRHQRHQARPSPVA
jgi:acetyl-CoA C-acetyltransferase